ncbi:lysis protein [Pseudomonas sp. FW306-02-F02-AA]|uniref:Lysozyme n=1 Tax=Pseudomonas fluorescens TaxID=294 RepID=A0A0N9WB18_PSEFL|nr:MULTISPECIES: lysis system i-spanin subunit Rz [Pseudomonas]ALI04569.1 lysozyme [Pseudomonas fluorescens]PMZ02365.1 lysis protein [Pseudomonas sp. FW306-02-F02-AB]PMZ09042.1 lysis protein [Pseudomonas sp. FW306-02-H06C]PMZ14755.1 lysis protein [Pseudomonas sp. FW306-02-F02-AA]PMZ19460.1 lysis protein [Pseudomonas sp. FW306-02-F08-AA]
MSVLDLIPAPVRPWAVALVLLLVAGVSAAGAWQVQKWRYGKLQANQAMLSAESAEARANAALAALEVEQGKRLALEAKLKTNDDTHYKELSDAKKGQQRLSDRLATADVRLSVLLATGPGCSSGNGLPAAASAGSVVHGGARAELDPAHAQRIVAITGDGDQGLIALAACQAYAKEVSTPK